MDTESTATEPLTDRGRRTREVLVQAARRVFEERGWLETRLADISSEAGLSYGSFYTYFPSKDAILREVALRVQADFGIFARRADGHALDPFERIDAANRIYFEAYKRNARIMAILEQVSILSDELRRLRRDLRYAHVTRTERAIKRWQAQGLVPDDIHPRYAASALGSMVDRTLYVWLVLGEPFDEDAALDTLNRLWVRALGLTVPPGH
jgi:AcrR family transcriptional regulator